MNNFLLFLGALLVAALVTAFAAPRYIEWNDYRATFEDEASRLLGRRIRVGGSVDLRLLPTPYVQFENLRVAGNDGHFGTPMFKAKSVKMWLSVTPLVQGKFEAEQIQLNHPELRLELDETGNGNWNSGTTNTQIEAGRFRPNKLALQEVIIVDGKLTLLGPNAKIIYALDQVNGEFSANSLEGPFKFKGTATNSGIKRKISFTSTKAARDGSLRFKSTISYANTGVRYTLDGKALDYLTNPRIEGDLVATLQPLNANGVQTNAIETGANAKETGGQATSRAGTAGTTGAPLELKGKLQADAKQLKLTDISLSFEQAGRPQRLSGEVLTTWNSGPRDNRSSTRGSFNASWLDLDQIAGASDRNSGPLGVLVSVVDQLSGLFASDTASRVSLKIDQANLGGDTVSNIELDLAKNNGIVTIEALRAQMPGRAQIKATGQITGDGKEQKFDGEVAIHGGNLKQFLGWAEPGGRLRDYMLPATGAGTFTSTSQITLGSEQVSVQSINAEFENGTIYGAAKYRWQGSPALTLNLESPRLNADRLLPNGLTLSSLMDLLNGRSKTSKASTTDATKAPATGQAPATRSALNKTIKLSVGELVVGNETYQDGLVDLVVSNGTLVIPRFRFSSSEDLELDFHGSIASIDQAAKSKLRGFVKANKPAGVAFLSRFFQLPAGLSLAPDRRRAVAPLRLAVTMNIGPDATGPANSDRSAEPPKQSVDLVLAGSARGSQLTLRAWLQGGLTRWYSQPVDISLNATNSKAAELVTQLLPAYSPRTSDQSASGRFNMTATGIPSDKLLSIANLDSQWINARFDGTFKVSKGDASNGSKALSLHTINGQMRVDASNATPLLLLASIDGGLLGPATPLKGTMKIASRDNALQLNDIQLVIAGNGLTGTATIVKKPDGRRSVTADLTSNQLSLRGLMQPVLSQGKRPRALATAQTNSFDGTGDLNIWPASSFDFKPFEKLDGTLKLSTPELRLGTNLTLANSVMKLSATKGEISLQSFTGDIPGGRITSTFQLSRARAGARMNGRMRVEDVDFEKLFAQEIQPPRPVPAEPGAGATAAADVPAVAQSTVTGTGTMEISFAGQALSPRGMIGALTGKGTVKLGPANLRAMNPDAVNLAADAVLDKKAGDDDDLMREELTARLTTGVLKLGPRVIKLTIADGALRAQTVELHSPHGSVATTNTIDLTRLRLDSEWQIKPVAQVSQITGRTMTVLPPVTITYVGNLGELASLEPRISVGALMRELTVRNMERDVEQLELIRQRDEEIAKRLEARRKALELERARQKALIEAQRVRDNPALETAPGQSLTPDQTQGLQDQNQDLNQNGTQTPSPQNGQPVPGAGRAPGASTDADTTTAPVASEQPDPTQTDTVEDDSSDPEQPSSQRQQARKKPKPKWNPFSGTGVFAN